MVGTIQIGEHKVGPGQRPLIVAELSGNHNQSLERAIRLVEAAAEAGAHGVKLQTYTPDTMTLNVTHGDFVINDPKSLWHGRSLYDLYAEAQTPWDWHEPILERCRELGLVGFSTPFDASSVDFLESLNVPCYKIASFEVVDIPLIRKVAATGKPIIASTGMATIEEIDDMVTSARTAGCSDLILLKCTSSYPASPEHTNLHTIPDMRERFGVPVGLSDHTMGIGAPLAAVALGAVLIEKHYTLARSDGGPDAAFSLEPQELKALVEESERGWQALGTVSYQRTEPEQHSARFRRSLYFVRNMKAGETIDESSVRAVRPAGGLAPKHLETVLGRTLSTDVSIGTPVSWDVLEDR